jgi:acetyltransferase
VLVDGAPGRGALIRSTQQTGDGKIVGHFGGHDHLMCGTYAFLPCPFRLKDGTMALIREAGPEDFSMLYLMCSRLSGETMFRRFRTSNTGLEAREVREMLRLEDPNVTSMVAIVRKDGKEQAGGEAHYVTDSAGRLAEAGVVIAEDLQNRGLGTALLSGLVAQGRRQGLKSIFAHFDVDNKAIIRVGQKVGFRLAPVEGRPDYSMIKAEIELAPLPARVFF